MKPAELFAFCPRCGQRRETKGSEPNFACAQCGFVYYFNPASAAAGFLSDGGGQVLFIRRAKAPAQGKLAVPGGFIDFGETAESALRREIREEVNLEVENVEYLCSHPNEYPYRGVTYMVLDVFFRATIVAPGRAAALDGVESLFWVDPKTIDPSELAFPSVRAGLEEYLRRVS